MLPRIEFRERYVDPITTEEGQQHYYDISYDLRPRRTEAYGSYGLIAPDGAQLLPEIFADVFTQFDAVNHPLKFIPVFNGEAWGLVANTSPLVMTTDFIYNKILPERWEHSIYFVQDKETLKWGALRVAYPQTNGLKGKFPHVPMLKQLMPPIAEEIYEDELMTDCAPTLFWMTRIDEKVGILTPHGYSKIIYDKYVPNPEEWNFRLIQNGKKRAKLIDYTFVRYNK